MDTGTRDGFTQPEQGIPMRILTIMAGGGGVRFWPESRRARPKQFLSLGGEKSLLRQTAERSLPLFGWERISVITGADYAEPTREQLPEMPIENLLLEPSARNTAACLGLAAAIWAKREPEAVMAVAPADHLISPDAKFQGCLEDAFHLIEKSPETVCLLGVVPTRPATGFGYIEVDSTSRDAEEAHAPQRVLCFREKPDVTTATEYAMSGRHYWNAGIFVWKAQRYLELLGQYAPQIFDVVQRMAAYDSTNGWSEEHRKAFAELPSLSVDHAVLEPLSRETNAGLMVIPADFAWSDVGSWQAWPELWGRNEHGNTLRGSHIAVDTSDCIVETSEEHLVATFGVEGLLIVHTPTATLVARRDDEAGVRRLVAEMDRLGFEEWL